MRGVREVDLAVLREAFFASGESGYACTLRLGWRDSRGATDTSRFLRALGVKPTHYTWRSGPRKGEKVHVCRQTTSYENAVRYARAIGVDPVEVGL